MKATTRGANVKSLQPVLMKLYGDGPYALKQQVIRFQHFEKKFQMHFEPAYTDLH